MIDLLLLFILWIIIILLISMIKTKKKTIKGSKKKNNYIGLSLSTLKEKFQSPKVSNKQLNLYDRDLEVCSLDPLTGWFRNGKCQTDDQDHGSHLVCAKMSKEFLDYTKEKGNDLYTVVQPGQNWCLCQYRWNQAFNDNKEPLVYKKASNHLISSDIKKNINISLKKKKHI